MQQNIFHHLCENRFGRAVGIVRGALSIASVALIAGCGGGGTSTPPGPPPTATIGGTVSGLIGKLVLQDNAGDNLALTANGAFTFPTSISTGGAYAVTVLQQPPGPTCVVSNGSGTANSDVTNVSVTCTTDPATAFLPLTAVPFSNTTGASGLFVISTKSLDAAPIQITTDATSALGSTAPYSQDATTGSWSSGLPYAYAYTTIQAAGGDHIWLVNLSGTSTLVPTRVSSLTVPSLPRQFGGQVQYVQFCSTQVIAKNLADPSSAFIVLGLPTDSTNFCLPNASAFKWLVVHASDGPNTDPVSLPTLSSGVLPLYQPDGMLAGLVALDSSHNLNFYRDETFTNPVQLLANIASFYGAQEPPLNARAARLSANPTYSFLVVQPQNTANESIYRIDYSGSISADLYDSPGAGVGQPIVDSGSAYIAFAVPTTGTAGQEAVVKIPNGGGGAAQILSMFTPPDNGSPNLVGLAGGNLVFKTITSVDPITSLQGSVITTLSVDAPGTPTTIASYTQPTSIAIAGSDVFVTITSRASGPALAFQYSTQILDASSGNVLQPTLQSSFFVSDGAPIMQVRNITAPSYLGGGQVYPLDLGHLTSPPEVPLGLSSGATFSFANDTYLAGLQALTATIGVGDASTTGDGPGVLLAYDLAKGVIAPISMPNTSLQFVATY